MSKTRQITHFIVVEFSMIENHWNVFFWTAEKITFMFIRQSRIVGSFENVREVKTSTWLEHEKTPTLEEVSFLPHQPPLYSIFSSPVLFKYRFFPKNQIVTITWLEFWTSFNFHIDWLILTQHVQICCELLTNFSLSLGPFVIQVYWTGI